MGRGVIAVLAVIVIGAVMVWALVLRDVTSDRPADPTSPSPSERALVGATTGPTPIMSASPPATSGSTPTPTDEPTPAPTPRRTATLEPAGDPRLLYAGFLARLDDDRRDVARLNQRLLDAAQVDDAATVRSTALDILAFVDDERGWLAGHAPADCYADAHAAAGSMLEAYATVAERAIDWADAKSGLDRLAALAIVGAAAEEARISLDDLLAALQDTTCLD